MNKNCFTNLYPLNLKTNGLLPHENVAYEISAYVDSSSTVQVYWFASLNQSTELKLTCKWAFDDSTNHRLIIFIFQNKNANLVGVEKKVMMETKCSTPDHIFHTSEALCGTQKVSFEKNAFTVFATDFFGKCNQKKKKKNCNYPYYANPAWWYVPFSSCNVYAKANFCFFSVDSFIFFFNAISLWQVLDC